MINRRLTLFVYHQVELGSTNFLYNAYMYNAVYAWAYAYNKTLDSSSRYYSHTDEIIKNMKGLQFRGKP